MDLFEAPDRPKLDMLTTTEVAKEAKVDYQTVRRWVKEGKLSAIKIGLKWFYNHEEVHAFIEAKRGRSQEALYAETMETP